MGLKAKVEAVSANKDHSFTKVNMDRIRVVRDHGVEADAHFGTTVQHLHLVKKDPTRPNLRQVHLIALERIQSGTRSVTLSDAVRWARISPPAGSISSTSRRELKCDSAAVPRFC